MERIRLKIQLAAAVLLNIGLLNWHTICFPVLNCHSCPISVFACPLGVIGQFVAVGMIPLSVIGLLLLTGLILARFLCGWVCPFGFVQELLYKVPYIKFGIPNWLRFIKYGVFAGLVVAVPVFLSTNSPLYFCRLCPVGSIESAIPWAVMRGSADAVGLSVRLGIVFGVAILAMGHRRFFCKVICPLGACLSVLNRLSLIFPRRGDQCTDCAVCGKTCPMEIDTKKGKVAVFSSNPEECISCLECHKKCPTRSVNLWG